MKWLHPFLSTSLREVFLEILLFLLLRRLRLQCQFPWINQYQYCKSQYLKNQDWRIANIPAFLVLALAFGLGAPPDCPVRKLALAASNAACPEVTWSAKLCLAALLAATLPPAVMLDPEALERSPHKAERHAIRFWFFASHMNWGTNWCAGSSQRSCTTSFAHSWGPANQ